MLQSLTAWRRSFSPRSFAVLLVVAKMATVTQLKPETWLVYFHEIKGEIEFKWNNLDFKISMSPTNQLCLKLLKQEKGGGK